MTESDARSLARTGEFHIQEAIMGLLDDAADGLMFGQLVRILALPDLNTSTSDLVPDDISVLISLSFWPDCRVARRTSI